jgi:hypothetical protein
MHTYTPIPYWLSLPWREACAWAETVVQVLADQRAAAER